MDHENSDVRFVCVKAIGMCAVILVGSIWPHADRESDAANVRPDLRSHPSIEREGQGFANLWVLAADG